MNRGARSCVVPGSITVQHRSPGYGLGGAAVLCMVLWLSPAPACAQTSADRPSASAAPVPELQHALMGRWVGVLTYRDYSQAADSTRRVQLPTWLSIDPQAEGLGLHYTYDDGPGKTVNGRSTLVIDGVRKTYKVMGTDEVLEDYKVEGLEKLRGGLGELVLSGPGKESGVPVEVRETLTIRRNLLSWLRETRPLQTSEAFSFRHLYTFVREAAPATTVPQK